MRWAYWKNLEFVALEIIESGTKTMSEKDINNLYLKLGFPNTTEVEIEGNAYVFKMWNEQLFKDDNVLVSLPDDFFNITFYYVLYIERQ